jgi:DNA-binding NtrC family response regulator
MIHISAEEQAKIKSLARHLSHLGCDRVDSEKLLEMAWANGANFAQGMIQPLKKTERVMPSAAQPVRDSSVDDLAEVERQTILRVFGEEQDIQLACQRLGVGKTTLYRRLLTYGVRVGRPRSICRQNVKAVAGGAD